MHKLNWDLHQLQKEQRDGSHTTRRDRSFTLAQAANALHELGFRGLRARGVKGKHVVALVAEWRRQGLSEGTMANRLWHVRWWARKVGKPNVVSPNNADYGIGRRQRVAPGGRSRELPDDKLALVRDAHVRMSLRLQAAFGLRREEAIKFVPGYADRGNRIALKASWTKGGRAREVPVLKAAQRRLLDEARGLVGGGALIPPGRNFAEQRKVYEAETERAGLDHMHGLRHRYAITRYEDLTGWKAPAAGGPSRRALKGDRKRLDAAARLAIAGELGHGRAEVVGAYLAV